VSDNDIRAVQGLEKGARDVAGVVSSVKGLFLMEFFYSLINLNINKLRLYYIEEYNVLFNIL
jgi:hypothetical protein